MLSAQWHCPFFFCGRSKALKFSPYWKPQQIKLNVMNVLILTSVNRSDSRPSFHPQTVLAVSIFCSPEFCCLSFWDADVSISRTSPRVSAILLLFFSCCSRLPPFLFFSPPSFSCFGGRSCVAQRCAAVELALIFHRSPLWWSRGNAGPH